MKFKVALFDLVESIKRFHSWLMYFYSFWISSLFCLWLEKIDFMMIDLMFDIETHLLYFEVIEI